MAERVRGPRGIVGVRARLVDRGVRSLQPRLRRYFLGLERRIVAGKSSRLAVLLKDDLLQVPDIDWRQEDRLLTDLLRGHYDTIGEATFGIVSDQVGATVDWNLSRRNIRAILSDVAVRVTDINEVSRDRIRSLVLSEIERGSNADRLESQLRVLTRSWAGLSGPVSMSEEDRRRLSPAEAAARSRAHAIALTETGNAFNRAAIEGYRESGLVSQVIVYDGDDCGWRSHDDTDLANRSTRTLDEAAAQPLSHPHCQRAFGPQVERVPR